ncbi:MAG: hypothetical protein LBH06_02650 [Rikenellaceae bacterium]|jgi:hypothetical protein|nr:hypothetical protein [Rikenellaceae bacterium]
MKRIVFVLVALCMAAGVYAQKRTPKDKVEFVKQFVALDKEQSEKLESIFTKYAEDAKALLAQTPVDKAKIAALKKKLSEDMSATMSKEKYDAYAAAVRQQAQETQAKKCANCPRKKDGACDRKEGEAHNCNQAHDKK